MKNVILVVGIVFLGSGVHAAKVITESVIRGDWDLADFRTIASSQANGGIEVKKNDTKGVAQSFVATGDGTVKSISILAQRLVAGADFGLDVYELFSGDGRTPQANPDKIRIGNTDWAVRISSFSLNSSVGIGRGDRGGNLFTVVLDDGERFALKSGHAYAVHLYSKVSKGASSDRLMLWDYADSDTYEEGTYGVPGWPAAARDLGLAFSVEKEPETQPEKEPETLGLISAVGMAMLCCLSASGFRLRKM